LHICQQIVEAHSGSIRVDTSKLGGAKFEVTMK
jgi:signal transduction histidine kinase